MQNRMPRQRRDFEIGWVTGHQPRSDAGERLAEEGNYRMGGVQTASPAAERGGIGHTIGIFGLGCRLFPGAVLLKVPVQRLTASQQAIVGIREGKPRQEGKGLRAIGTATAPDSNPIVTFIVRLLAAATVADDRIAFTHGASAQDGLAAVSGPIGFVLVERCGKWDKKDRSSSGLCSGSDLAKI
jgi:hypothetical protein